MVKRILAIVMCICILMSLTACWNRGSQDPTEAITPTEDNETNQNENDDSSHPSKETVNSVDQYIVDEEGNVTNIRKNGKLPSSKNDITDEEIYYYIDKVMNAVFSLDVDTLKIYALNEDDIKTFEQIAASDFHKEMYIKTIGNVIYLSESHLVVYKDPFYIYSQWFNDQTMNGGEAVVSKLTIEDVNVIYNRYYDSAIYIANTVYKHSFNFELKGGNIYFAMDEILQFVGYSNIENLNPANAFSHINMIFGTTQEAIVDSSIDGASGSLEILDIIVSRDLDEMVKYVDGNNNYDLNYEDKEAVYDDCYQLYYKNETLRKKISGWMDENVAIYGTNYGVATYIRANISHKDNWPYNLITDAEIGRVSNLPICARHVTREIGDSVEWGHYYAIVEQMICDGAIEDLYVH